jgi:hypothetical protein
MDSNVCRGFVLALGIAIPAGPAGAQGHPEGVSLPLRSASIQPDGLAQPLPSTRRYCLVWADQLADAVISISDEQKQWIVTHYVGTQKLFRYQIDEYRSMNPEFLMLVYHVAYGLNGADHAGGSVGNITGPDSWGQEDTDCFQPWFDADGRERENAYMHVSGSPFVNERVQYPDPFWLMDIRTAEWRDYLFETLLAWQGFPTDFATGVFLDVAFHPWYRYEPSDWWEAAGAGTGHGGLAEWWNPLAADYFDAMRAAFAPTGDHPRHLVIPNPDCLQDEEPEFLHSTDGAFTENWQCILDGSGTWAVSARRVLEYVTSQGKVWMVQISSVPSIDERGLLIGSYFLLKNGTSYFYHVGEGAITWYPEYEIDLGWYLDEPPVDLEDLRVAGGSGGDGLYRRDYSHGLVLVNASDGTLSTDVGGETYRAAEIAGGGAVDSSGAMPAYSLDYTGGYTGTVDVPARSALLLQIESGPPPPGEEPDDPPADESPDAPADVPPDTSTDAIVDPGVDPGADVPADGTTDATDDAGSGDGSTGCGCTLVR